MINIYINNKLADYFGDLTIKKDSPYFMPFDKEPAGHTYTLTLPTTATNAQIFALIQHSLSTPPTLNARITIDGIEVLNGTCRVQSWDESGYSVYFTGVTPYSDSIGESPIKRLYADKRTMQEVFANYNAWNGIYDQSEESKILWFAPNLITGDEDYDAIVKGWAFVPYIRATGGSFAVSSSSHIIGMSVGVMLQLICNMYRISIKNTPNSLAHVYTCTKTQSDGSKVNTSEYFAKKLPNVTTINYLQGLCAMTGCRLRHDYVNDILYFENIQDHFSDYTMKIEANNLQIQWGDTDLIKGVKYTDAPSIEREYTTTEDGEEVKKKEYFPLSSPLSTIINSKGNKDYVIPFSIPLPSEYAIDYISVVGGSILMSTNINDVDDYTIFCQFNYDLEINNKYGWFTPPPSSFTNQSSFDDKFSPLRQVAEKKVAVKFSAKLNPLEFNQLDAYPPLCIPNVSRAHIKTLAYKTSGETEIEAYIY